MNKKRIIRNLVLGVVLTLAPFVVMAVITCVAMISAFLSGGTADPHYNWITFGLYICFVGMFLLPIGIIVIIVSLIRLWRLSKQDRIAQQAVGGDESQRGR